MVTSASTGTELSEGGTIEPLLLDLNLGQENAGRLTFRVKLIHSSHFLPSSLGFILFDMALATLH